MQRAKPNETIPAGPGVFALVTAAAVLALVLWLASNVGWTAAGVVGLVIVAVSLATHVATLWDIRTDGYVLEKKRDGTGRSRWRVGIREAPPEVRVVDVVEWIPPAKVGHR